MISQEDFAKLRKDPSSAPKGTSSLPAPPPMTPQNTPSTNLQHHPAIEELEGMDFELEEDMVQRSPEVPRSASKANHRHPGRRQTERFYPVTKESPALPQDVPRKRKTRHSKNPPVEMPIGWIMDSKEHRERTESFTESAAGSLGSRYQGFIICFVLL